MQIFVTICDKSERAQFKRLLRELESCVILSFFLCVRHPQQQQAGLESQNGCPKIDGWKRGKYICNCEQKWMFYKPQTVRSCHGWKLNNQSPSNFDMQPLFVDRQRKLTFSNCTLDDTDRHILSQQVLHVIILLASKVQFLKTNFDVGLS